MKYGKVAAEQIISAHTAVQKRDGSSSLLVQNQDGAQKTSDQLAQAPGSIPAQSSTSQLPYMLASSSAQGQNNHGGDKHGSLDEGANQNGGQFQVQGSSASGGNNSANRTEQRQPFGTGPVPVHILSQHQP